LVFFANAVSPTIAAVREAIENGARPPSNRVSLSSRRIPGLCVVPGAPWFFVFRTNLRRGGGT